MRQRFRLRIPYRGNSHNSRVSPLRQGNYSPFTSFLFPVLQEIGKGVVGHAVILARFALLARVAIFARGAVRPVEAARMLLPVAARRSALGLRPFRGGARWSGPGLAGRGCRACGFARALRNDAACIAIRFAARCRTRSADNSDHLARTFRRSVPPLPFPGLGGCAWSMGVRRTWPGCMRRTRSG